MQKKLNTAFFYLPIRIHIIIIIIRRLVERFYLQTNCATVQIIIIRSAIDPYRPPHTFPGFFFLPVDAPIVRVILILGNIDDDLVQHTIFGGRYTTTVLRKERVLRKGIKAQTVHRYPYSPVPRFTSAAIVVTFRSDQCTMSVVFFPVRPRVCQLHYIINCLRCAYSH